MFRFAIFIITLMLITSLTGGTGYTQEPIIFPAKGQSDEQMDQDKYACYTWAKKESKFDPMAIPTASAPPTETKRDQSQRRSWCGGWRPFGCGFRQNDGS